MFLHKAIRFITMLAVAGCFLPSASAVRLKDICDVQGARGNPLRGMGLVVGLAATGDQSQEAVRAQERMLDRLDIEIESRRDLVSDNTAVVVVTAMFPSFAKEGTRIDVQVSSLYDAESLEGGILLQTNLEGIDGRTYAVAQGPISVGGFNVSSGGAQATKNHTTVGRIPMGAYIEREIPSTITDGEHMTFLLKKPDFSSANNIRNAINKHLGGTYSSALGAGSILVRIPPLSADSGLVAFIAELQELDVDIELPARVVINERTGTIVVGHDVMIHPCQVAHGSLSITIATTPVASQPPPFSGGETVAGTVTDLTVTMPEARLAPVQGTSAADVADALNRLKVTPRDMIAIFQALREAGALEADIEIM